MTDRRTFIGSAAAGVLGASPLARLLAATSMERLGRIGLQLYTIRKAMEHDFEGSLAHVARIGYREVEFAGYFDHSTDQVRRMLHRHGLTAPSAHISLEDIRTHWDRTVEDAHSIGHKYLVCAWIIDEDRTVDGYRKVAGVFNRAAETARKAGIEFGYHNHSYEFVPVDGQLPYDILLAASDPALVKFELDLFRITKGGADPLAYFAKYPGRFPLVHVKDMSRDGKMVDVGKGTIDFRRIFADREQAGIRHFFVEHDEPANPFASIASSYAWLRGLRF
jgi:sugar phosphate isomerase/epimerase